MAEFESSRVNGDLRVTRKTKTKDLQITGVGTATTVATGTNDTQIATTALTQAKVDAAITAIRNGAPANLNTLLALAAAIANDPNFSITVTSNIATAKQQATAYTDQQITQVTATGVPKLNSYPLVVTATTDGQTRFDIPLDLYDAITDTILVFENTSYINPNGYTITNTVQGPPIVHGHIDLTEGVNTGTEIVMLVFKNVAMGVDGSVNGSSLAVNSVPENRIKVERLTMAVTVSDTNNKPTTVEYRRFTDSSLHTRAVSSNPDTHGYYQTVVETKYDVNGTTLIGTTTHTYTYNADGIIETYNGGVDS
jgi:hypothetical protein